MHGRWATDLLDACETVWEVLGSEGWMDGRMDGRMAVALTRSARTPWTIWTQMKKTCPGMVDGDIGRTV